MASLQELEAALVNADKAGDSQSAAVLAQAVQQARAQTYVPSLPAEPRKDGLPHQLGLTVRGALQGAGDTVGMFAEPLRLPLSAGLRALGLRDKPIPNARQLVDSAADAVGIPAPETPKERIANDAVRTMSGVGLMSGAAKLVNAAGEAAPVAKEVLQQFSRNPGTQIAGAAGSGTAGGAAREAGFDPWTQFAASVVGGVGTGSAVNAGGKLVEAVRDGVRNFRAPPQGTIQFDATMQNILGPSVNWQELPQHVRNQMRNDVEEARKLGPLTEAAVRRLVDYRLAEATPSRAGLTLDPVDITQQRNLSKLGANSKNADVQGIARLENDNAKRLGGGIQEMAGNVTNDRYANSEAVINRLRAIDSAREANVSGLYKNARDSLGNAAPLDHVAFSRAANLALDEAVANGSLPDKARSILNDITTGKIPLNVATKEQIAKRLYGMGSNASDDERHAINLVRRALDDAPLAENHGLGPDALAAYRAARTAHAERMAAQEASPALKFAVEGGQPDAFFQQFVIGNGKGNVKALENMKAELGDASPEMKALRGQLVAYLMKQGGIDPKAGTISQAGLNNALDTIGPAKLSVFFTKDEIAKLQSIGRVAQYEQVQPRGSAVNNSNTTGSAANAAGRVFDAIIGTKMPIVGPVLGRLVGSAARDVAQSTNIKVQAGHAANVPSALALIAPKSTDAPMLSPALAALLAAPQEDQRKSGAK